MKNKKQEKKEFDLYMKNSRVFHDYNIDHNNIYEAGLALQSYEIKSVVAKHISLSGAYCHLTSGGEITIVGMYIKRFENGQLSDSLDEYRERRLLLHKSEIAKISRLVKEKGMTLVPVNIHLSKGGTVTDRDGNTVRKRKNIIKIDIAVAKGAKNYDKRETIKKRDNDRQAKQSMKRNS
ncbi:MAG: SsrA-binding protein [Armatimonadetes bacterium]|nr:SsrA-binding protein [Candidatus Hippobium faecium]